MVFECSHRRGAMNSQNSPSPSSIFLTFAAPRCVAWGSRSASITSSSWNCTPSKPSFLYSRIFEANATSLRTGGPNGSAPVLMFHGPKVNLYERFVEAAIQVLSWRCRYYCDVSCRDDPPGRPADESPARSFLSRGCFVSPLLISCESCDRHWAVATPYSLYEQQTVESCPCPHCGAYTLSCPEPAEPPQRRGSRRHSSGDNHRATRRIVGARGGKG